MLTLHLYCLIKNGELREVLNSPFILSYKKWRVTGSANSPFILSHRATGIGNSRVVFSHNKCRVAGITNSG